MFTPRLSQKKTEKKIIRETLRDELNLVTTT